MRFALIFIKWNFWATKLLGGKLGTRRRRMPGEQRPPCPFALVSEPRGGSCGGKKKIHAGVMQFPRYQREARGTIIGTAHLPRVSLP